MADDEEQPPASFSSLRARFEQQSLSSSSTTPKQPQAQAQPTSNTATSPTLKKAQLPPIAPLDTKPAQNAKAPPPLVKPKPKPAQLKPTTQQQTQPQSVAEQGEASAQKGSKTPSASLFDKSTAPPKPISRAGSPQPPLPGRRVSIHEPTLDQEDEGDPFSTEQHLPTPSQSSSDSTTPIAETNASAPSPAPASAAAAKKVAPPPPPSRKVTATAKAQLFTTAAQPPKSPQPQSSAMLAVESAEGQSEERPSLGVKALANRFASASATTTPAASRPITPPPPAPMITTDFPPKKTSPVSLLRQRERMVSTPTEMSRANSHDDQEQEEEVDPFASAVASHHTGNSSSSSILTSSSEAHSSSSAALHSDSKPRAPPARPIVPPRPQFNVTPATEPIPASSSRAGPPPPIPARSPSIPPTTSPSLLPTSTVPPLPARGANGSFSSLASLSSSTSSLGGSTANSSILPPPPPPPQRKMAPVPPALPSRAGSTPPRPASSSVSKAPPTPARPATISHATAPPTTDANQAQDSVPYLPPPPPSRLISAGERLAPQRPALIDRGASGGEDSSEEEEDEQFSKSLELPDATFANRRPPALRNKRPVAHQFHSWAIRGKTVATAQHHVHIWHPSRSSTSEHVPFAAAGDQKVLAMEFKPLAEGEDPTEDGRYVWAGTKEGHLFEVDTVGMSISASRLMAHAYPITAIYRLGKAMVSLDDSGRLLVWGLTQGPDTPMLATCAPATHRIAEKQTFAALVGDQIWTSSGPHTGKGATVLQMRSPMIRVYDPSGEGANAFSLTPKPITTPESAGRVGAVTASAIVPAHPNLVYLAHDDGLVSVWDRESRVCSMVRRVSVHAITTMVGIGRTLWAGERAGFVRVYDVGGESWRVEKKWRAHKEAVTRLVVDPVSVWTDETLQVASSGADGTIAFWDGFLRDDWLDHELHLRQPEYCTFRTVRSLHVSWNIDACRPTDLVGPQDNYEFLEQCLTSTESPDIISFGFQEVIDLENKKLTAKSLLMGKKKGDQKFGDAVSSGYRQWHDRLVLAVRNAMPPDCPYTVVHVGDMVGLLSVVFVKTSERAGLRDLALIECKTGMGGRYGNKGGLLSRFVLDDTSICLINVHLAAGQGHRRQRNADLVDILEDRAAFSELASSSPGAYTPGGDGTAVFDHELTIISGDFNYRIDRRREDVMASIKNSAWEGLLAHDQLRKGLLTDQSFRLRSFKEQPITFAPTYKYDPSSSTYDSSPKKRIPAWCDRVLYRTDQGEKVTPVHYRRYECNVSDHRPISAAFDLRVKRIVSEKRAEVWREVESAWFGVESGKLEEARRWYGSV